jgi:probable F420-dependent oxidoreductase
MGIKVRIGYGLGVRTALHTPLFGEVVDRLESHGFDSLWLSERLSSGAPDPLVALAYAAGRTTRLKLGTSVMVLPGRNPVVLAKELATLATMSGGRLLPAFGLGAVDPVEQAGFGVARSERAGRFDEMLGIMRACWTGEPVHHGGGRYEVDGAVVRPVPGRLEVWLGGNAPSELRRVGRLADGWLPSFVTPGDAEAGRSVIESVLAEHWRSIDDDHYGVLIPFSDGPAPDAVVASIAARRPDLDDPKELIPTSPDGLADLIERFIAVGTSKFVVLPLVEPRDPDAWADHIDALARCVLPLERTL